MKVKFALISLLCLCFIACSNAFQSNVNFENTLVKGLCDTHFFNENLKKLEKNEDVIYTGINAGLIARNCGDFKTSTVFFDAAEEAYKYDVDLQNLAKKGVKFATTTLVNDTLANYEGSLYERIMVNVYKGLNFMNLNDYANARVEFNRALIRQEKAKEYFAKELEKNRQNEDKKEPHYDKNIKENSKTLAQEYDNLFKEFNAAKNFTNPYATYLAAVFFFMDEDYRRAFDLFREVAIINPTNLELQKEAEIFNEYATKITSKENKKYIFVIYENGMGAIKDEFSLALPFIVDGKIISLSVALQTLKKREASFSHLNVNGLSTSEVVNLDDIVATEFKIHMPTMISKALTQSLAKATLNLALANNDSTGGWLSLLGSAFNVATTRADVRSWRALPKSISVAMLENLGHISIQNPQGQELYQSLLDKNKNALILVRSFTPYLPSRVNVIQK